MNLRTAAANVIYAVVIEGHSLTDALSKVLIKFSDPRDQALIQAICYGICRWYERLNTITGYLLTKPLKEKDQDIHCLLLVGLYQLMDMRIPKHAAVAETVAAVSDFKKIWAKRLVNAILRNYIRQHVEIDKKMQAHSLALYSHPEWISKKIMAAWPEDWRDIMNANNQHPPFALRVNQKHMTRTDYIARLPQAFHAHIIPETQAGIILDQAVDVMQLPGFAAGDISVQDGAAQLAAELLELTPKQQTIHALESTSKQHVLDACAAPGGKTAHILETQNVELIAVDVDDKRMQTLHDNLARLKLSAHCITADVGDIDTWWDGTLFDRILLDAPCSASGVIRRHPDIKLLRRATDIPELTALQTRLLHALWTVLKPGGLLVYATCSVFPEENVDVVSAFLHAHPEAEEKKIHAAWGKPCQIGRQILPGMHGMDGFYFACLRKLESVC